ncbi:glutaredoxin domain-containing protein [Ottowia sp.]|uniref:glutaredoxin domain-containing protein n=1 Tax=Ottowia sp. TaxID=1898956 RepID=UPI003A84DB67
MQVIIYGKDNCTDCNKTKMLCQIQSVTFEYRTVGQDISADELQAKVGQPVRSLPQIFVQRHDGPAYVGGYEALRTLLQAPAGQAREAAAQPAVVC